MFIDHEARGGPAHPRGPRILDEAAFRTGVELLPLVSIDLLLPDEQGRYLLGLRNNPPAQGYWFAPGGRIRKDEPLQDALRRLVAGELGMATQDAAWTFSGVHEHFYDVNFAGEAGMTTHYVVLAYRAQPSPRWRPGALPDTQHRAYRWLSPAEICADPGVHPNTQAYFTEQSK
jgi:colanic acid biosynthesis protein WcaH